MTQRFLFLGILSLCIFCGCVMDASSSKKDFEQNEKKFDLPQIIKRGELKVLFENASSSYFSYRERPMGFEYEVLREFCKEIGVDLEVNIIKNLDNVIDQLRVGEGDLIACNLTITKERDKIIDFSRPLMSIQQVLVQRKPNLQPGNISTLLDDPSQLARKKVNVWKESVYYDRLIALQDEIGDTIYIKGEDGVVSSEELIELVAEGLIDYTVVEENIAKINQRFFENLDISLPLSAKQKIAFGIRQSSPLLKARLDQWLAEFSKTSHYKYIYHKYFNLSQERNVMYTKDMDENPDRVSPYDEFFKQAGNRYDIDWRWLAALSFQESRFNPEATSFGGAYGMMQFMPEVGPAYDVYPDSPPEQQIMGGAKKIRKDLQSWKSIPNDLQRMKFALGSYNCGKGHILDAQRLAKKYGKDPLIWDENVEEMVLKLSRKEFYRDPVVRHGAMRGTITYKYVREIYGRYLQYCVMYN